MSGPGPYLALTLLPQALSRLCATLLTPSLGLVWSASGKLSASSYLRPSGIPLCLPPNYFFSE